MTSVSIFSQLFSNWLSPFLTSSSVVVSTVCPPPPHLHICLLPPLRSKWRTPPRTPPAAPLLPPPPRPPPPSPSLLHCCALHLRRLPPASSVSLLLCRHARSRTERPTTTLPLRSSDPQSPPRPPPGAPASGPLLPAPPLLQGSSLHRWSGSKWSSPPRTDIHTHTTIGIEAHTQISMQTNTQTQCFLFSPEKIPSPCNFHHP